MNNEKTNTIKILKILCLIGLVLSITSLVVSFKNISRENNVVSNNIETEANIQTSEQETTETTEKIIIDYPEEPEGDYIKKKEPEDNSYTLYIGLSNPDTGLSAYEIDEAEELIKMTCIAKKVQYTISQARGGYIGNTGMAIMENTLVLRLDHIDDNMVDTLSKQFIKDLQIGNIMVEKMYVDVTYVKR